MASRTGVVLGRAEVSPTALGIVLGLFLTVSDTGWITCLVPFVGGVLGVTLGGWYWVRQEAKQTRDA